jgi:predicted metal-dependent hydrolase
MPGSGQPHPTNDPAGHSYGAEPPADAFRWGIDLYHHGYFWEAHEAWEELWREAEGPERELLAGLIQLAATALKIRGGQLEAARRLGERAEQHLRAAGASPTLDASALADQLARWLATEPLDASARPTIAMD